tara:strand:- start:956 stop:1576 length:621 start_codon:yes stop_codon:yes gene_type:complete
MPPIPLPPVVPIPEAFDLPVPTLAPPTFELPKWEPIPIRPKDIPALNPQPQPQESNPQDEEEEEEQEKEKESEERTEAPSNEILNSVQELITPMPPLPPYDYGEEITDSQVETVEIFGKFEVPVPKQEIMVTAVATAGAAAVASVGATMVAGKLFNQIVKVAKPVIKIVLNKLAKLKGKPPAPTWARQRLGSRLRIKGRTNWKDGS